jgi:hypothetical protein
VACGDWGSTYPLLCDGYTSCDDDNEILFQFVLAADDGGGDLSWDLRSKATGAVIFEDIGFENQEITYYERCLANDVDCYILTIYDSGPNPGFCCDGPDANGVCCVLGNAGFAVAYGNASYANYDNPTWEGPSISLELCLELPAQQAETLPDMPMNPPPSSPPRNNDCNDVTIDMLTDSKPEETSIFMLGDDFEILIHQSGVDLANEEYFVSECLEGCLRFGILDDFGDGFAPPAGVSVTYRGREVTSGLSDIGFGRVIEFGAGCPIGSTTATFQCEGIDVYLQTDSNAHETSFFVLVGPSYDVLIHHRSDLEPNTEYRYSDCVSGCITVGIFDTFGNGMNSPGKLSITYGEESIANVSDFGFGQVFRLGKDC